MLQSDLYHAMSDTVSLSPVNMSFPAQLSAFSGQKLPSSLKIPQCTQQILKKEPATLPDMPQLQEQGLETTAHWPNSAHC